MAGLLGDVLPWAFSQGDRAKRYLGGLLADPIGSMQQTAGLLQDYRREDQQLNARAFADQSQPFRVTDKRAMTQLADRALAGPLGVAPVGITAWHGSPHTFDKFDSSKIGSGVGAQAYGHGLYLAEAPEVANQYTRGGDLYKVDLPDEKIAKMLDWDKPLSKQTPEVRAKLESIIAEARAKAERSGIRSRYWPPNVQEAQQMTGEMLHKTLGDTFPSIGMGRLETATQKAGIPGIRYLDGGSPGVGAGTSSFVVFPGEENALKILERNGQPLK